MFLKLAISAVFVAQALSGTVSPNLIFISVDDMGFGDPSCYGGSLVATPQIDRLAENGIRSTAGYVTSPICGPSRYGFMTGAYQQRFGVQTNNDVFSNEPGDRVPRSHLLLPEILNQSGYHTGLVGKWNLKSDARIWFDEVYSLMDWGADYFPNEEGVYPGVWQRWPYDKPSVNYGWGPVRDGEEYLTDRLGRQSVEFIHRNKDQPFFLYLGFNGPHSPLQAKASHQSQVEHIESEPLRLYAAMVLSIDENVGKILDALDDLEISENTFIVFISDNGPSYAYNVGWPEHWDKLLLGDTGGLSGRKAKFEEGGVRVPYILSWPDKLNGGETYDRPISVMDIYPTFCEAAGVEIPEGTQLDGVSLLPFLNGLNPLDPHESLYWYQSGRGAMRSGDWKLIVNQASQVPALYDLETDPEETDNLASERPEIRNALFAEWETFTEQLPLPFSEQYANAKDAYQEQLETPPEVIHENIEETDEPSEAFKAEVKNYLPDANWMEGNFFYSPTFGLFESSEVDFPLINHSVLGLLELFSNSSNQSLLLYSWSHTAMECGPLLGWVMKLSDQDSLYYSYEHASYCYLAESDSDYFWVYEYRSSDWYLYQKLS